MEPARKKVKRGGYNPQRLCQHTHNGHLGRVRMIQSILYAMNASATTVLATKYICRDMLKHIDALQRSLAKRINADGTVVEVGKGKRDKSEEPPLS
jgi:hypothetical protein